MTIISNLEINNVLMSFAAIHAFFMIIGSIFIFRTPYLNFNKKILQLFFINIVPLLGSLITIYIHISDIIKNESMPNPNYGDPIDDIPDNVKLYYSTQHLGKH